MSILTILATMIAPTVTNVDAQSNGDKHDYNCAPGEIPKGKGCVSCGPGEIQVATKCQKCPKGTFANGCCRCDPELPEGIAGLGETQLPFVSENMANSISSSTGTY
ncbi:MAG: hypothetical protein WB511_00680 [Nitrososphaeraceae archaeon]